MDARRRPLRGLGPEREVGGEQPAEEHQLRGQPHDRAHQRAGRGRLPTVPAGGAAVDVTATLSTRRPHGTAHPRRRYRRGRGPRRRPDPARARSPGAGSSRLPSSGCWWPGGGTWPRPGGWASAGRPWPVKRWAPWWGGLAVLTVATQSGLAAYDTTSFAAHAVQHLLLGMLAPLLLALGAPVTLALQASRRTTRRRLLDVLHSRPVRLLTHPLLAWTLFGGSMFVLYFTRLYADVADQPGAARPDPSALRGRRLPVLLAGGRPRPHPPPPALRRPNPVHGGGPAVPHHPRHGAAQPAHPHRPRADARRPAGRGRDPVDGRGGDGRGGHDRRRRSSG